MRNFFFIIGIIICSLQQVSCQEDGAVSFKIPIRNSLKFNRYIINPTFSFVREQRSYLSFYTKRQWVQFENAPQTYLFGYSGRITENQGVSLGLFQQNYGVLNTFGGVANFAQNVRLEEDSNLTFGLNVGFYKSGINNGKVITNFPDPSLNNIPSNTLLSVNPGVNYGTAFLDFGLSINNLILYNIKSSETIADDPEKSIEAHVMHTGYLDTYGFFDKSKFSALIKTEFKKEKTVVSGLVLFGIPNGVWAQAGYNSVYGMSAGVGLNISNTISIEYNFEKGTGNLSNFGSSHEIVFAYKFKNKSFYYGDGDDEEGSIIHSGNNKKYVPVQSKQPKITPAKNEQKLKADLEVKRLQKLKQIEAAKAKATSDSLIKAKQAAATKLKIDSIAKAKQLAKAKNDSLNKARQNSATKTNTKTVVTTPIKPSNTKGQAKIAPEKKDSKTTLNRVQQAEINKLKIDSTRLAKQTKSITNRAKIRAKTDSILQAKREAYAKTKAKIKAKNDSILQARQKRYAISKTAVSIPDKTIRDERAKADAVAKAKLEAQQKANTNALAKAKLEADEKAKAEALAKAKLAADEKAKAEALVKAKLATDEKAKAEALAKAKLEADEKGKAEALAKAKLATDEKAKAEALAKAKLEADEKVKEETFVKAKPIVPLNDENAKSMDDLARLISEIKNNQQELLKRFNETVSIKDKDLKDLKEENDLSEKGIFKAPKPFKSITAENKALQSLQTALELANTRQKEQINALEQVYFQRLKKVSNKNDAFNQFYKEAIDNSKKEQLKVEQLIQNLNVSLEKINTETEIEKKRRIKRASFENDEARYTKDRATLNQIKDQTPFSASPLKPEDFDFGEEPPSMQILKNVNHTETGYYLIVAVHNDTTKRDQFLTKTVAAGQTNIDFFYDVNSSKYFIYYGKFDDLEKAKKALKEKGTKPYNGKLSIVKIENN